MAPYYWINDPIEDKKAITESTKFLGDFQKITLASKQTVELTILVNHYETINMQVKNLITGESNYIRE